jgi:glutaconyl-CoA/methylmalonyl-CoA decarboxylase subunit gamma
MRYFVTIGDRETPVDVVAGASGALSVSIDGRPVDVDVASLGGDRALSLLIDGQVVDLTVEGSPPELGLVAGGTRVYVRAESERMRLASHAGRSGAGAAGDGTIVSPMPGRVVRLLVAVGDAVEASQAVVVVEAMKMENELKAPRAGVVEAIVVEAGVAVETGQKLLVIGDAPAGGNDA